MFSAMQLIAMLTKAFRARDQATKLGQGGPAAQVLACARLAWCATTILQETGLPDDLKELGASVLCFKDRYADDRDAVFPPDVSQHVRLLVMEMTFRDPIDEGAHLLGRSDEVKLFKLYEKVADAFDWTKPAGNDALDPVSLARERISLKTLTDHVEARYGRLRIVAIARAFCADL